MKFFKIVAASALSVGLAANSLAAAI